MGSEKGKEAAPKAPEKKTAVELSPEELERIVADNTGLVRSVVARLSRIYGEDSEDLAQIGFIGLIKAARRFEPERGLKFSTYAVPLIAGEIRSQMRDRGNVKISRSLRADAAAVRRAGNDFEIRTGRSPRLSELAEITGFSEEKVRQAVQTAEVMSRTESYDRETAPEIADGSDTEEINVTRMDIASALNRLDTKERQVMVMRYYRDMTQVQTAKILGISQVQVCRIEKKALLAMAKTIK